MKIDIDRVDDAINVSVRTIAEQVHKIRAKIRRGEELSQAEVRLPASCAASLAAIRRSLHLIGADTFTSVDIEGLRRGRDELDALARGEFSAIDA